MHDLGDPEAVHQHQHCWHDPAVKQEGLGTCYMGGGNTITMGLFGAACRLLLYTEICCNVSLSEATDDDEFSIRMYAGKNACRQVCRVLPACGVTMLVGNCSYNSLLQQQLHVWSSVNTTTDRAMQGPSVLWSSCVRLTWVIGKSGRYCPVTPHKSVHTELPAPAGCAMCPGLNPVWPSRCSAGIASQRWRS